MNEEVLLRTKPVMFKAHPIGFAASVLLILAYGIGLLILGFWWLSTYSRELIITERRVRFREGILSNKTSELEHRDIKSVKVEQGAIENMTGAGTLKLSSAGTGVEEITAESFGNPDEIRDLIYKQRQKVAA